METASQSGDRELAEELLVYFIEKGKECFASCLFVCYDLIHPDVALELAWMNNMIDFAFPYLLQFIREYTGKVDELVKDKIEALSEVKAKEKEEKDVIAQQNMYAQLLPLALPAPPMPGMGGGMGGGFAPPPFINYTSFRFSILCLWGFTFILCPIFSSPLIFRRVV